MKIIIAGSRKIKDSKQVIWSALDVYFNYKNWPTEIVCGCAPGVDSFGEQWAKMNGIPVKRFPPNWEKHGKAAGPIRNREMGEYADQALIFWDGESSGTKNMISIMQKLKKPYYVWKP